MSGSTRLPDQPRSLDELKRAQALYILPVYLVITKTLSQTSVMWFRVTCLCPEFLANGQAIYRATILGSDVQTKREAVMVARKMKRALIDGGEHSPAAIQITITHGE